VQTTSKHFITLFLATLWLAAIAFGVRASLNYETTPGRLGTSPQAWPTDSKIHRAADRNTLVMLAHPRCPCTRASVNELAKIMAHAHGSVRAFVLFWTPQNASADWEQTDLRRTAATIPGVTTLSDPDGLEAHHFGAETSGHTLLFDPEGRLLFSGGITASRGHDGDNMGESTIVSLINHRATVRRSTNIFGCALTNRGNKEGTPCPN
jgi:hypothetical protein